MIPHPKLTPHRPSRLIFLVPNHEPRWVESLLTVTVGLVLAGLLVVGLGWVEREIVSLLRPLEQISAAQSELHKVAR